MATIVEPKVSKQHWDYAKNGNNFHISLKTKHGIKINKYIFSHKFYSDHSCKLKWQICTQREESRKIYLSTNYHGFFKKAFLYTPIATETWKLRCS